MIAPFLCGLRGKTWVRQHLSVWTGAWIGVLLLPGVVHARDMQGRLGLGYNSEFGGSYTSAFHLPAVSLKYALTRDIALEGSVGIATVTPSDSVTAVKFFKNLFLETNLNFYFAIGGGIININGTSGGELLAAFGAEFFIPGIESLGLSFETGASFDNGTGSYALKTLGFSFLDAGMHFYF